MVCHDASPGVPWDFVTTMHALLQYTTIQKVMRESTRGATRLIFTFKTCLL